MSFIEHKETVEALDRIALHIDALCRTVEAIGVLALKAGQREKEPELKTRPDLWAPCQSRDCPYYVDNPELFNCTDLERRQYPHKCKNYSIAIKPPVSSRDQELKNCCFERCQSYSLDSPLNCSRHGAEGSVHLCAFYLPE